MRKLIAIALGLLLGCGPAFADKLISPTLHVPAGLSSGRQVALTLDACSGDVDWRILNTLVDHQIPATIFVTYRWLKHNDKAVAVLVAHPELFDIEDHGLNHIPAVTGIEKPYGVTPAGTLEAVLAEVDGGAAAIVTAAHVVPRWYRGATALYSADALKAIQLHGYRIAGFSLNADFGATASEKQADQRIAHAVDGDVIIAHINQPKHPAGAGVAEGVVALKAKGFRFVTLSAALGD